MATRMKQKAEARQKAKDTRPYAKAKYIRMSPSKVRIVLDTIRGKKVGDAVAILENSTTQGAEVSLKVLKSAIANGEYRGINRQDMYVAECYAGPGPTLKRLDIRAKGRANRLLKRTCHITIILGSEQN